MLDDPCAPDPGVMTAAEPEMSCPRRDRPWVLTSTILGSSLVFITGSVVHVALPAKLFVDAGHTVALSNARGPETLAAQVVGPNARHDDGRCGRVR